MLEVLGTFGEEGAFRKAAAGQGVLDVETLGQLTRRVARLEEILETYRDGKPPDRRGFDALLRRLADHGIEEEMESEPSAPADAAGEPDDEEDE